MKRVLSMVVACFLVVFLASSTVSAAGVYEQGAKTPPPPVEVQDQSLKMLANQYLDKATVKITDFGDQTVELSGLTFCSEEVDLIGVTFYFQKWTGKEWIDIGSPETKSDKNRNSYVGRAVKSVESGYYYRTKTKHFIEKGMLREHTELTSGNLLVK